MDYNEVRNKFLLNHSDYSNDINNFTQYLEHKWGCGMTDPRIDYLMNGLRMDGVLESLEFLIENDQYKKKETAKRYVAAVGQFLGFIKDNTMIDNDPLFEKLEMKGTQKASYLWKMSELIARSDKLEDKESFAVICKEKIAVLLTWCDESLNEKSNYISQLGYRKVTAAICIKFMLLYGITYRSARKLRMDQINVEKGILDLNGFQLRFSPKLDRQIMQYVRYKEENKIFSEHGFLFTTKDGQEWKATTSSSGIPNFLNGLIGQTDISGIVKYGISQLLKAGLNDGVIKMITGASDELIDSCMEQNRTDIEMERIINERLVHVDLYYDM